MKFMRDTHLNSTCLCPCVCVQCMCETLISRLPSWEGLLRFFLILIFNLNKRKVSFFVCASRGVFIALGGVAAGGRKHN